MSYDIYGNHLRPGHCEVHPDVHEVYPCSYCLDDYGEHEQMREQEYDQDAYNEWCAEQHFRWRSHSWLVTLEPRKGER